MCRMVIIFLLVGNLLLYFPAPPAWGQESSEPGADPKKQEDMAALADKINNPLSELWLLFTQSDFQWWDGKITDKKRLVNISLLQPVMPMALTDNWRMIIRPIIPIASMPFSGFDYETGPRGRSRCRISGATPAWGTRCSGRLFPINIPLPIFLDLDPP